MMIYLQYNEALLSGVAYAYIKRTTLRYVCQDRLMPRWLNFSVSQSHVILRFAIWVHHVLRLSLDFDQ